MSSCQQCKPSIRTEESIKSRVEHIKHLLGTGAVKDWNREDAIYKSENLVSEHGGRCTKKSPHIVSEHFDTREASEE